MRVGVAHSRARIGGSTNKRPQQQQQRRGRRRRRRRRRQQQQQQQQQTSSSCCGYGRGRRGNAHKQEAKTLRTRTYTLSAGSDVASSTFGSPCDASPRRKLARTLACSSCVEVAPRATNDRLLSLREPWQIATRTGIAAAAAAAAAAAIDGRSDEDDDHGDDDDDDDRGGGEVE